jgi:hypothetical protein
MPRSKLSREEQILLSIEEFALCREYLIVRKKAKTKGEINEFLYALQKGEASAEMETDPESLRKNLDNYRKRFHELFISSPRPLKVNWQMKIVENYDTSPENMARLSSLYLKKHCIHYDEKAMLRFIENIPDPGSALYYLVAARYAAKFGLELEIEYAKRSDKRTGLRQVLPIGFAARNGYLDLIALDLADGKRKQFIMSLISRLHTDLYRAFYRSNQKSGVSSHFDYARYLDSPEGRFGRTAKEYRIQVLEFSFNHFKHSYDFKFKVAEQNSPADVIVVFRSSEFEKVQRMVFDYGRYCKMLSPLDEVEFFSKKVSELSKIYK